MKTSILKKIILFVAVCYIPLQSMAWGTTGHRVCGQVADSYLTPKARKAIQAILGNESLALASNWADFIRSDSTYKDLTIWHYINLDKVYKYPELLTYLKKDTAVDAYVKLSFLSAELKKKNLSKTNRLLYLHMLIHLVEDLHQPLHTGHEVDEGGNKIKFLWFGRDMNAHTLWDSGLIDFQQLSYTEYATAINHTTAAQRAALQKDPISQWIFESNQIAGKIYTDVKPGDKLGYEYNFKNIATLNQQMLKAGVRLAGLLNQIFG